MDTGVLNTTLGELEKSVDEVNRTHDDMMALLNDTYSTDDTSNDTTTSDVNKEFSSVTTMSPTSETTTVSLESTNIPTTLELNDSLITTTEFMAYGNETSYMTEKSTDITKMDTNTTDTTTDATTTAHSLLISITNDTVDYSQLTTSSIGLSTTDINPEFNDTIEMFKPMIALNNESKIISQPLISLIDDTKELESPTTVLSLEPLANTTENISTDTTSIDLRDYTYHPDFDSETTVASIMDITDFTKDTKVESTTQSILDETEAVTFVVEGEPDADLAFSLFKNPEGLKLESYRMLDDNESSYSSKENIFFTIKEDDNVSFTTENEVTLMPTVATTTFPDHFAYETGKHDNRNTIDNATNSFTTESISSTSGNLDSSMNTTSIAEIKHDNANVTILSHSNVTENHDLMFESIKDQIMPKSENLVKNNLNNSMSLIYEDDSTLDITNKSSLLSSNETEIHDLIFYNVTEKTVPKSAGLIKDDMNYSIPLAYEDDLKFDIENTTSLSLSNETEKHDLIFYNITDKSVPKLIGSIPDIMNDSVPLAFKNNSAPLAFKNDSVPLAYENDSVPLVFEDGSSSSTENTSVPFSNMTEKPTLELDNENGEFMPRSFDSIMEDVNYSAPLTLIDETKTEPVNTLLLPFNNMSENHDLLFHNKTEDFDPNSGIPVVNDMNYSIPLTFENDNTYTSSLYSHNLTENPDLELDSEVEEFVPKSEGSVRDDMNQSIPLTVESDKGNASSLSYAPHSIEEHDLVNENMTDKIIPKSVVSITSDTINYSLPLSFDEDGRSGTTNESLIDVEHNKAITNISEPELHVISMDDSIMKMHLTSEELNVLPENDTLPNFADCGVWAENSEAMKSDNQNPFNLWPAVGYLEMISDSKKCPSTVISPKYVITSLNCLISSNTAVDLDPDMWTYVGGLHSSDKSKEIQTISVNKIIPYPGKFLLLNEHDVALVRMNDSIDMNEYSKSACLAKRESKPGKECFTAGWNKNSSDGDIRSQFYSFPITIISVEECNNTMNYNGILIDDLLCGVREKENVQSCYMDFGSPLFCLNENKHWELQGILNRPDPCDTAKPIVFSDILSVRKWINETLTNDDVILDTN